MQENGSPMENQNDGISNTSSSDNEYSKWVDNQGMKLRMFLDSIAVLSL